MLGVDRYNKLWARMTNAFRRLPVRQAIAMRHRWYAWFDRQEC